MALAYSCRGQESSRYRKQLEVRDPGPQSKHLANHARHRDRGHPCRHGLGDRTRRSTGSRLPKVVIIFGDDVCVGVRAALDDLRDAKGAVS